MHILCFLIYTAFPGFPLPWPIVTANRGNSLRGAQRTAVTERTENSQFEFAFLYHRYHLVCNPKCLKYPEYSLTLLNINVFIWTAIFKGYHYMGLLLF